MNNLPNNILAFDPDKPAAPQPIIAHPKFRCAYEELERVFYYSESKLIFVVGPTGAGKTTLKELLCQRLEQDFLKLPEEVRRGRTGTICVKMPPPPQGSFSFRPVMYTLLSQLEIQDLGRVPSRSSWGGQDIMTQFSKVLRERKPLACMLDEAQNLSLVGNPMHLLQNLAQLNCLADSTFVKFVLFGTHDLVEILNVYPALVRRVDIVRIESYNHTETPEFVKLAWGLLKDLKLEYSLDPEKDGQYLFERSLGSIGLLRKWLTRAAIKTRLEQRKLTRADIEVEEMPLPILQSMLLNVSSGQEVFNATIEGLKQFQQSLLDLGPNAGVEVSKKKRRRGSRRPGIPLPRRYPVGHLTDQVRAAEA